MKIGQVIRSREIWEFAWITTMTGVIVGLCGAGWVVTRFAEQVCR